MKEELQIIECIKRDLLKIEAFLRNNQEGVPREENQENGGSGVY